MSTFTILLIVLLIAWILGFGVFRVAGGFDPPVAHRCGDLVDPAFRTWNVQSVTLELDRQKERSNRPLFCAPFVSTSAEATVEQTSGPPTQSAGLPGKGVRPAP
jgi:hypothetical protein